MKTAYTTLAKYYDLIFQDKNYPREVNFIRKIVKKRRPDSKSILDVGCGTGTHLNLLKNDFKTLHGVDLNLEIIEQAKKKSPKINYSIGEMAGFNLGKKFDLIICLYSVINYNLSPKAAKKTLSNFKKHLNPKGLVILALYTPYNTERDISLHLGRKAGIEVAKINQFFSDKKTKIQKSDYLVLIKDKNGVDFFTETGHRFRIYEVEEFKKILTSTGFENIEAFDNFTHKAVTEKTKYPVLVANLAG